MKKTISSETISFRIDTHLADEVRRKATEAGASSIHFYARELFLSGLADLAIKDEINRLQESLGEISQEILELRHDFYGLLVRLFASLGEVSLDEAEQMLTAPLYSEEKND